MNENFAENLFLKPQEKNKNASEVLKEFPKSKILDLIEGKAYPEKKEILKNIEKEYYWPEGVDWNVVESENTYQQESFIRVGSVEVRNNTTGEAISLALHCDRAKEHYDDIDRNQLEAEGVMGYDENGIEYDSYDYDPSLETFNYDYVLVDSEGVRLAIMNLKDYTLEILQSKNISKEEFGVSTNLLNYEGDPSENPRSFTYIDQMFVSKRYVNKDGEEMDFPYEGCGRALHQVAVEHSIRNGFEGRIQLVAAGIGRPEVESAGFHEDFGYCYKNVFEKNGELHHEGQEIHQALAESRWEEAQKWKEINPREKITDTIRDTYRPHSDKALYAYFPEESVIREKERMLRHQNLQMNLETLGVAEKKRRESDIVKKQY